MKLSLFLFLILFCAIVSPAFCELSDADLENIRLLVKDIVNESEKRIMAEVKAEFAVTHKKIDALDTRLRNVETDIAELRGRSIAISVVKDWGLAFFALVALIVSIKTYIDNRALRKTTSAISPTTQDTHTNVS